MKRSPLVNGGKLCLIGFFEVEATPDRAVGKVQDVAAGKAAVDRVAVDAAAGINLVPAQAVTAYAQAVDTRSRI